MTTKAAITGATVAAIASVGFVGGTVKTGGPGLGLTITLQQA